MLNIVFLLLVAGAAVTAAFTGTMEKTGDAALTASKTAVDIALGLIGQMALWLGFMRVFQEAGLMRAIARVLRPVMTWLFPEVPPEHPAMGAMVMNIAANAAGVGNAATPFGLKAMQELNRLNRHPGVATNAMALFLAINTGGVTLVPLTVIAVRASLGSHDAAGIILPSICAGLVTTVLGVVAARLLERLPRFAPERSLLEAPVAQAVAESKLIAGIEEVEPAVPAASAARLSLVVLVGVMLLIGLGRQVRGVSGVEALHLFSAWILPLLMAGAVLYGFGRHVRVYEAFIAGAKDGFQIAVGIIPYLVAILVAFALFRGSGAMDAVIAALRPLTRPLGIPPEVLPMGIIRTFSGSGALGVMTDTMKTHGVDSLIGYMVSVMNGSTETTFYVLAVYFGSVQVRAVRHTLLACLTADAVGLLSAVYISRLFFGG